MSDAPQGLNYCEFCRSPHGAFKSLNQDSRRVHAASTSQIHNRGAAFGVIVGRLNHLQKTQGLRIELESFFGPFQNHSYWRLVLV